MRSQRLRQKRNCQILIPSVRHSEGGYLHDAGKTSERNGSRRLPFFRRKTFRLLEEQGAFVETATYNSHRYGCLKSEIAPNKAVILEPEGVGNFLKLNDPSLFIVVLTAEEKTRIDRMRYRKDKEADIEKRIATDRSAFSEERLPFHHMKLATDGLTIDEAGDLVYRRYCEHLRSL